MYYYRGGITEDGYRNSANSNKTNNSHIDNV